MAKFRKTPPQEEPETRAQTQSKKKKPTKNQYRLLQISAALALAAGLLVAAWAVLGSVRFSNIEDVWKMTGRRGEGFPLPTTYASLQQAALMGESLVLLGPTALNIHAPNSYVAMDFPQPYHAPALCAANGRLLLFDRDSGQFTLMSKTKVLHEDVLEHDIFCMDLGDSGAFAVGTKAESAASELYAYDARLNKRFGWRCEKEYPGALRLSNSGRGLAACLIGTEQAEVYTRFMEFDFNQTPPRIDLRLDGVWLYGVSETSGGWLAVGDQAAYLIKRGAKPQTHGYEGRTLDGYDADGGYCAILLQDWDNRSLLRVYNRQGALVLEQGFRQRPLGVQCRAGTVYLQFADRLVRWNSRSGFRQSTELPAGTQKVFVTGSQAYALTLRNVEQMRLRWSDAEDSLF